MSKWPPAEEDMTWKIIFSVVTVRVIPKYYYLLFSWESIKRFSKNEIHILTHLKYPKIALNTDENHVKID